MFAPSFPFRAALPGLVFALAVLFGSLGVAAAQEAPLAGPTPVVASTDPFVEYAPDTVLVKLEPGATLRADAGQASVTAGGAGPTLDAALQAFGAWSADALLPAQGAGGALANAYRVRLAPGADVPMAAQALAADPAVAWAEPDYVARAASPLLLTPNDPEFAAQWALTKIGAPAAWDITTGSADTVIAFIDSGVDVGHVEFAGRVWVNGDEIAGNGVDDDQNGYVDDVNGWNFVAGDNSVADSNGHGTQVGAVAGAAANNGAGIAGVCWQCRLMFVTAMQPGGAANYSDIAAAVNYAFSNGADVINLSLGGYADSQALHEAIGEASTTALIVAGAGNDDGSAPFYPAAYPQAVAVAATDENDAKPVFSNFGPWVDVSAPGTAIRTATLGGNAIDTGEGTSLSTAFVSGLAGLLKSKNPGWTAEQMRWQLLNTAASTAAADPAHAGQMGAGRINAQAALATTPQPRLAVESFTVDGEIGGKPAPGQSFQLVVTLKNTWLPAPNLAATLSSADSYVTITDNAGAFGSIGSGQSGSNGADPFAVTLAGSTPYGRALAFTLDLSGSGGYAASVPFTVNVRSSTVTLGNTQYTQDTVWTSDKTYVLDGAVIVGAGVTLTIQPGTVVKVAPGKFIRVDGTLIARGTAEQPIVFTTKATDGSKWAGLRFTATAKDAVFAANGTYLGGSIVQHVDLSDADVGLALNGRAPYVADSYFRRTSYALKAEGNQALQVERNTVEQGILTVGGGATVLRNTFTGILPCGVDLTGGSPLIMQNTLDGCGIWGGGMLPALISNTVRAGNINLAWTGGDGRAPLPSFLAPRVSALAPGGNFTCALTSTGGVKCWGYNGSGQLGDGTTTNRYMPVDVSGPSDSIQAVAAGQTHTCALTTAGGVKCWGLYSQLGDVSGLTSGVQAVAVGYTHTCALTSAGGVKCWGENNSGQLGDGTTTDRYTPADVSDLTNGVQAVAAGQGHTCALTSTGGVKCWGENGYGQLGDGTTTDRYTPVNVSDLTNGVQAVAAGQGHTCVLTGAGGVKCWGDNFFGQLGDGTTTDRYTPVNVGGLTSGVQMIAVGGLHACALTSTGGVKCWGNNSAGQLGDGTTDLRYTPVDASGFSGVQAVAAGYIHTCALTSTGGVKCWGSNNYGQLGDGTTADHTRPVDIVFGTLHIQGNLVHGGGGVSVGLRNGTDIDIRHNTVFANVAHGIALSCGDCRAAATEDITIYGNNLFGNGEYDLRLEPGAAGSQNFTVNASGNFWGVPAEQIAGRIRDCTFDDNGCNNPTATLAKVNFSPPLAGPDQTAPAFVTNVNMNPNPVGLQRGTLTVDFSRPMDTSSHPVVTFKDSRAGTESIDASGAPLFWWTDLTRDAQGRLWVTGHNQLHSGVLVFDGVKWSSYTAGDGGTLPGNVRTVFAASNGDVWISHEGDSFLSRLRGTQWTIFTVEDIPGLADSETTIGNMAEDAEGGIWASPHDSNKLLHLKGAAWEVLPMPNGVRGGATIAVDSLGRLWLRPPGTDITSLPVYDHGTWIMVPTLLGLPASRIEKIVNDSMGRLYVKAWSGQPLPTSYTIERGVEMMVLPVGSLAFALNGNVWISQPDYTGWFDGVQWHNAHMAYADLIFDLYGNLWYGKDVMPLRIRRTDQSHAFDTGTWATLTRWIVSFDFTPRLQQATYLLTVESAVDADGISTGSQAGAFTVAYAGGVTTLPPAPPTVTASSVTPSLKSLGASWTPNSADIAQYRYAIGTTPGGRNVVGWTYLTATSFTRNDLSLVNGQTYYVSVQARNAAGLWSVNGVSGPVLALQLDRKAYLPIIRR